MTQYYTLKEDIKKIVQQRRADEKLLSEIRNFFVSEIGKEPINTPNGYCILARHLYVARRETFYAKALSDTIGLKLLVPSFAKDRFVTISKEKISFVRPHFEGNEKPTELLAKEEVVRCEREKLRLEQIALPCATPLLDYHKNLAYLYLWQKC